MYKTDWRIYERKGNRMIEVNVKRSEGFGIEKANYSKYLKRN